LGSSFSKKHAHVLIKALVSEQKIISTFGVGEPGKGIAVAVLS
jgi:hypothetical protein